MLRLIDGNNVFKRYYHTSGSNSLQTMYLDSISQNPNLLKILWVWDGKNSNQRRKDIYPEYKGNREPSPDEFYQTRNLFKELLTYSSCLSLEIPLWEADDIIAQIALGTEGDVEIVSTDQDFHTLVKSNLKLITDYPSKVPREQMKIYKCLVGDNSDNIPGLKGFGKGTWDKMSDENITLLTRFIDQSDVLSSEEIAHHIGFKPAMTKNFIASADKLRKFYEIVSFFPVPQEDIGKHLKAGIYNPDAAFKILADLFMI